MISGVSVTSITGTAATISWTTDQNATSQVLYGTTNSYGSNSQNSTLTMTHSLTITGLLPSTTYHFNVTSANSAGTSAATGDATFTTQTPPVITNLTATNITSASATITWTTDQLSSSQVQYGPSLPYASASVVNANGVTTHSVTLTGLTAATVYHYDALSSNQYGLSTNAPDQTFTTSSITLSGGSSTNFGSANVCNGQSTPTPCSQSMTLTYTIGPAATLGTPNVLTNGSANLDFTLASGSTCSGTVTAGSQCTVNVTFTPRYAGLRRGAVQITDSSGNVLGTTFIQGTGTGAQLVIVAGTQSTVGSGFSKPSSVARDGAGNLYVVDETHDGATRIAVGTGTQTTSGSGFYSPFGAALDAAGNLYIADTLDNRVLEISAAGIQTVLATTGLVEPSGVAVDTAGNLYITDTGNNRIVEWTTTGTQTTVSTTGLTGPTGIAVDAAGNLYIGDSGNNRVVEVANGGTQTTIGTGLSNPQGVAVDAAGDVYIADSGNNRVLEVPAGGGTQTTIGSGLSKPLGVTLDGAGDVFIADTGNARVVEVARGQAPTLTFASTTVGEHEQRQSAIGTVYERRQRDVIDSADGEQQLCPGGGERDSSGLLGDRISAGCELQFEYQL